MRIYTLDRTARDGENFSRVSVVVISHSRLSHELFFRISILMGWLGLLDILHSHYTLIF